MALLLSYMFDTYAVRFSTPRERNILSARTVGLSRETMIIQVSRAIRWNNPRMQLDSALRRIHSATPKGACIVNIGSNLDC